MCIFLGASIDLITNCDRSLRLTKMECPLPIDGLPSLEQPPIRIQIIEISNNELYILARSSPNNFETL